VHICYEHSVLRAVMCVYVCVCVGVILGVALLHLLDDSHDKLMAVTTKPRKHFHDLKEIVFLT
jgi:hypothetical protein